MICEARVPRYRRNTIEGFRKPFPAHAGGGGSNLFIRKTAGGVMASIRESIDQLNEVER